MGQEESRRTTYESHDQEFWSGTDGADIILSARQLASREFRKALKSELRLGGRVRIHLEIDRKPESTEETSRIDSILQLIGDMIESQQMPDALITGETRRIRVVKEEDSVSLVEEGFSSLSIQ